MLENTAGIKELIAIMKRLDAGIISTRAAQTAVVNVLIASGCQVAHEGSGLFRVYKEYFRNPTIHAQTVTKRLNMSRAQLLEAHRLLQSSRLLASAWQGNLYPRSLLVRYGVQLTRYLDDNPDFIDSIIGGQPSIYMLEIHPTKGACTYACRMCLWSGGGKFTARQMKTDAGKSLLSTERWINLLAEAKDLGVRRVIISGGGEPLLDEKKFSGVTEAAKRLGIETMIYTNGRLLTKLSEKAMDAILSADWLRISMHAATPEVYTKLINRPLGRRDLEFVSRGIERLVTMKTVHRSSLHIGIGVVIQEVNFDQIPMLAKFAEQSGVNFLDIRGDCIGISETLSPVQLETVFRDLRDVRDRSMNYALPFKLTIADDLLLQMERWQEMALTPPHRCWIPVLRPAIDPYGTVCACDSIGEPYTRSISPDVYVFGSYHAMPLQSLLASALRKPLGIWCKHCMPGQLALNALFEKIVADYQLGILPRDQPYFFNDNGESL